jgi:predicted RecB family endonuclease
MLITKPDGSRFVVEVKLGHGKTHFSSIAQMDSMASQVARFTGSDLVKPVLVTNEDVSPSIEATASEIGVRIVPASGTVSEIADDVVQVIKSI